MFQRVLHKLTALFLGKLIKMSKMFFIIKTMYQHFPWHTAQKHSCGFANAGFDQIYIGDTEIAADVFYLLHSVFCCVGGIVGEVIVLKAEMFLHCVYKFIGEVFVGKFLVEDRTVKVLFAYDITTEESSAEKSRYS